jgi:hypothetical protein
MLEPRADEKAKLLSSPLPLIFSGEHGNICNIELESIIVSVLANYLCFNKKLQKIM